MPYNSKYFSLNFQLFSFSQTEPVEKYMPLIRLVGHLNVILIYFYTDYDDGVDYALDLFLVCDMKCLVELLGLYSTFHPNAH